MTTKILLVEDNPDSSDYMSRLLDNRGYTLRTAIDGLEALFVLEDFTPDLIITDVLMPRVDGIQMVRVLRAIPKYEKIPILAISAYGEGTLKASILEGADRVLGKPVDFDLFFQTLEGLLNQTAGLQRQEAVVNS